MIRSEKKAIAILKKGILKGRKLTMRQRALFKAIASGKRPTKRRRSNA